MSERGTVKTSTILIAAGRRLRIFHTIAEVPPALRRKLVRSTSGANAGTVLIADRRGARELLRANLNGLLERQPEPSPGLVPLVRDDLLLLLRVAALHWRGLCGAGLLIGLLWWVLASGLLR
jgi:hypothetical protein